MNNGSRIGLNKQEKEVMMGQREGKGIKNSKAGGVVCWSLREVSLSKVLEEKGKSFRFNNIN